MLAHALAAMGCVLFDISAPITAWMEVVFTIVSVEVQPCYGKNTGLAVNMSADLSRLPPTNHQSVIICVSSFSRVVRAPCAQRRS